MLKKSRIFVSEFSFRIDLKNKINQSLLSKSFETFLTSLNSIKKSFIIKSLNVAVKNQNFQNDVFRKNRSLHYSNYFFRFSSTRFRLIHIIQFRKRLLIAFLRLFRSKFLVDERVKRLQLKKLYITSLSISRNVLLWKNSFQNNNVS